MIEKTKKKIIIFDFDGTLWDTIPLIVEHHQNSFKDLKSVGDIKEMYIHNMNSILDLYKEFGELKIEKELKDEQEKHFAKKFLSKPFSGIESLLIELKERGFMLAISSLSIRKNLLPILIKNNFEKYFDLILSGDDSRFKVDNVFNILQKEKIRFSEALFITDTLGDVREMNVFGVDTIAVTYGLHDKSFFKRENNENLIAIVNSVEELKNFLKKF